MAGKGSRISSAVYSVSSSPGSRKGRTRKPLLEVETENLLKQIAQYNQGLCFACHTVFAKSPAGQVRKLEGEDQDLKTKTSANLRAGNAAMPRPNTLSDCKAVSHANSRRCAGS